MREIELTQTVTVGNNGETIKLKLGEIAITSHIYHGHQMLLLELENCYLRIKPCGTDWDGDKSTSVAVTVKKGHPILKREGKYLWLKIYQKEKTKGSYAGDEWEALNTKEEEECPNCKGAGGFLLSKERIAADPYHTKIICPKCDGTGKIKRSPSGERR